VTIHNLSSSYVAFKLKSTAPKKYNVKPKDGILGPQATQLIEITLNKDVILPTEEDKFRVESIRLTGTNPEEVTMADAFKVEKMIVKQKICSVFDNPPPNVVTRTQNDIFVLEWPESKIKDHLEFEKIQIKFLMEETEDVMMSPRGIEPTEPGLTRFTSFSSPKEISPEETPVHVDTPVPKVVPVVAVEEKVASPKLPLSPVHEPVPVEKVDPVVITPVVPKLEVVEVKNVVPMVEEVKPIVVEPKVEPVVTEQEKSPKQEPKHEPKHIPQEPVVPIKKEIVVPHRNSVEKVVQMKSPVNSKRMSKEVNPREDELIRIVLERNELQIQNKKSHDEIVTLKKMFAELKECQKSQSPVVLENDEERYSIHVLLVVAITFFLVGYLLK
jgi:hypothetical protein